MIELKAVAVIAVLAMLFAHLQPAAQSPFRGLVREELQQRTEQWHEEVAKVLQQQAERYKLQLESASARGRL